MTLIRGGVYWARLDTAIGSETRGDHPVLVIQNNYGNESAPTTIVTVITSKQKRPYPFHVEVTAVESGLPRDGTVLLEQIRTLDKRRLVRKAGQLGEDKMAAVDRAIKISLAL